MQIIANAAPIGFEAEFTNQRGNEILYRGIMMPFSTDDEKIDFVYGVINWKEVVNDTVSEAIAAEVGELSSATRAEPGSSLWDEPLAQDDEDDALELTYDDRIDANLSNVSLDDCLATAREAAAAANASEGRTRHALYRAIGLAHAFALAARSRSEDYEVLLEEAGIVVQPRSPMTALAKLVFGATYDKTRLAEFVCAIEHALDENLAPGALVDHLHALPGGLKALVREARAAKRGDVAPPARAPRALILARRALAHAEPVEPRAFQTDEAGLAIVVMRREGDGSYVPVAALDGADKLAGRVLTAVARTL
jgi:hypothetical protein